MANSIRTPTEITEDLAYLCGVISGDGSLFCRPIKHEYGLKIVGNPRDEAQFYNNVIAPSFSLLFDLHLHPKLLDSGTTYGVVCWSKSLFYYLTQRIGLEHGDKAARVAIPARFKNSDRLVSAFIRGFADADFSLCLKKRYKTFPYYPVIAGSSKSSRIILEIADYLKKKEISFSLQLDASKYDSRFKKSTQASSVYIYGKTNLLKWMAAIGFSNPKILKKFESWRKLDEKRNGSWRISM